MLNTLSPITEDLAGQSYLSPDYLQTQRRICSLIDKYIAVEKLHEHLQDLPIQFDNPQPRPWKLIDWQTINHNQIIGLDAEVFLSILIGAMDTEAPICGYTQKVGSIWNCILRWLGLLVELSVKMANYWNLVCGKRKNVSTHQH